MIIGLTGGIGSGKTTIARALAARGYDVYDCDREAKRIIVENEAVRQAIINLLGEEAFIKGQGDKVQGTKYNTDYVAKRVFAEPALLTALNAIVHPAVKEDIRIQNSEFRLIFVESAILFEAELDQLCDKIFCIDAPEQLRIERTIQRDYNGDASPENINKVRARIRAQKTNIGQTPNDKRLMILLNDGTTTIEQIVNQIIQSI